MIQLGRAFQQFQLDIPTQRAKDVVGLRGHGLGGRLFQRGVLLSGFVIRFHAPSCAIDSGHVVIHEGGITGYEIRHAAAPIFVCEDLLDQPEREVHPLKGFHLTKGGEQDAIFEYDQACQYPESIPGGHHVHLDVV